MTARKGAGPEAAATAFEARETSGFGKAAVSKPNSPDPQAAPTSWRDTIEVHPAANLFPLWADTDPAALKVLAEDIKKTKDGLTSPIVLWSDGKSPPVLLDGRNRLDAIEIAYGSPVIIGPPSLSAGEDFLACNKVIVLDKSVDPWAFVISANIHRRHLETPEQRRDLIAEVLKANPAKSNRQVAEAVKVDHKTVASVRAEKEATGEIPQLKKTVGKDGKTRKKPTRKNRRTAKVTAATAMSGDIGPDSSGEIARRDARIEELQNEVRRLERAAAERLEDDDGEGLGALLLAWDRASESAREKFKARVGLVAAEND